MSKLFIYGTSLEGLERLSVEYIQTLLPTGEFLDIPGIEARVSMLMVPNFQPRKLV